MSAITHQANSPSPMDFQKAQAGSDVAEAVKTKEASNTKPAQNTRYTRLDAKMEQLGENLAKAMVSCDFAKAAEIARTIFALFQGNNASHRTGELSKLIEKLEENTKQTTQTYRNKLKLAADIGCGLLQMGAGATGLVGGIGSAVITNALAKGILGGLASSSTTLSYAGQGGQSIVQSAHSFSTESKRTALNGEGDIIKNEREEMKDKIQSAKRALQQMAEQKDKALQTKKEALQAIARG